MVVGWVASPFPGQISYVSDFICQDHIKVVDIGYENVDTTFASIRYAVNEIIILLILGWKLLIKSSKLPARKFLIIIIYFLFSLASKWKCGLECHYRESI